jgi:multicomponent Na+:H+ antiporter subunit G
VTLVLDVVASVLLLTGVALTLLAGIGVLRFPDVLTRMHAQTKPAVLGILLVLAGTALATRSAGLSATLLLVAAFQLLTAPVGAQMIGRAAHERGQDDPSLLVRDDLDRDALRRERDDGSPYAPRRRAARAREED